MLGNQSLECALDSSRYRLAFLYRGADLELRQSCVEHRRGRDRDGSRDPAGPEVMDQMIGSTVCTQLAGAKNVRVDQPDSSALKPHILRTISLTVRETCPMNSIWRSGELLKVVEGT